jgi:hypothetical protein
MPVFAFFDPRCPYCHSAFDDLEGEVAVRWIPTLALGPGGEGIMSSIMGDVTSQTDEAGQISTVTLNEDAGRVGRLMQQLGGDRLAVTSTTLTNEQSFALDENMQVMRQLYGSQASILGVPTFIVPQADGTAIMLRGYDAENMAEIIRVSENGDG